MHVSRIKPTGIHKRLTQIHFTHCHHIRVSQGIGDSLRHPEFIHSLIIHLTVIIAITLPVIVEKVDCRAIIPNLCLMHAIIPVGLSPVAYCRIHRSKHHRQRPPPVVTYGISHGNRTPEGSRSLWHVAHIRLELTYRRQVFHSIDIVTSLYRSIISPVSMHYGRIIKAHDIIPHLLASRQIFLQKRLVILECISHHRHFPEQGITCSDIALQQT